MFCVLVGTCVPGHIYPKATNVPHQSGRIQRIVLKIRLNATRVWVYTVHMRAAYAVQGIGFLLLFGAVVYLARNPNSSPANSVAVPETATITNKTESAMHQMTLRSPAFGPGERIPSKYTCDGENMSPPLAIDAIPGDTVSLVLTVEDPDVPPNVREDGTWDHWVVFNMSPATERIGEGETPEGVVGVGTGGKVAYGGPCPPDREHRYFFRVYALDTTLDLPEGATKSEVLQTLEGHVLAQAELMGTYARQE